MVTQVGLITANGEKEIGELMARAMDRLEHHAKDCKSQY